MPIAVLPAAVTFHLYSGEEMHRLQATGHGQAIAAKPAGEEDPGSWRCTDSGPQAFLIIL